MVKVWNPVAIDYSKGVDIYDPIENKIYTDSEARQTSKEIQSRLTMRGRVIGAFVEGVEINEDKKTK